MKIFGNHIKNILKDFNGYLNSIRRLNYQDSIPARNICKNEEKQIKNDENNIEIKPNEKVVRQPKTKLNEDSYKETSYFIENGLRKVYPYYFLHNPFSKSRWYGKPISDVLREEFFSESMDYYIKYLENGRITLNGSEIQDFNYKIKPRDVLTAYIHRHEYPVGHFPLNFIHVCEDLVVVNKPPSIPVNPAGRYRHNTLLFILAKEFNLKYLHVINRLDAVTSGIVMLARNPETANKFHCQLQSREVIKEYLCKVEGKFPNSVICEEPIECISRKYAIYQVGPNGKKSKSEFFCLGFNGKHSIVLCKPLTGRTHQIRVHLQYLGYPIINDLVYNSEAFGPHKGREGLTGKDQRKLLEDITKVRYARLCSNESNFDIMMNIKDKNSGNNAINNAEWSWQQENLSCLKNNIELTPAKNSVIKFFGQIDLTKAHLEQDNDYLSELPSFDANKPNIIDLDCPRCRIKFKDPQKEDLIMYLHAFSYKGCSWEFRTKLPEWIF